MEAPEGFDWVSCSAKEYGEAGNDRHLISHAQRKQEHWQTTVCGATANVSGIWRRNKTKRDCQSCITEYNHRRQHG